MPPSLPEAPKGPSINRPPIGSKIIFECGKVGKVMAHGPRPPVDDAVFVIVENWFNGHGGANYLEKPFETRSGQWIHFTPGREGWSVLIPKKIIPPFKIRF